MFVGHSRPTGVVWTVSGAGATIAANADNLNDGLPDTLAAFTWLTGVQNTGSTFHLRADWTSGAIVPRAIGFSNLLLPVGTKITASFRRSTDGVGSYPYAPAFESAETRIFQGYQGERTAWLMVQPGASPVVGADWSIWNDVNGVASIPAAFAFQAGEAPVFAGDDMPIDNEWGDDPIDPTTEGYSPSEQPYPLPGNPYRQLDFKMPLARLNKVFGDPTNANAFDYSKLFAKMNRGQTCLYVPRYRDASNAFSSYFLHRTAMLGIATKLPKRNHKAGDFYTGDAGTIVESPIPT